MDDFVYQDVIALLNACSQHRIRRKPHRLPHDRYAQSDCEFFFTICARHLSTPFIDPQLAQRIIEVLRYIRAQRGWMLFCYCLMPDHLHFIAKLPDIQPCASNAGARGESLKGILEDVAAFKSYTTSQVWWRSGGQGRLWQRSSYDRVIRYNDSVEDAVNYVLNNPVRKGLVAVWQDYPYAAIIDSWA